MPSVAHVNILSVAVVRLSMITALLFGVATFTLHTFYDGQPPYFFGFPAAVILTLATAIAAAAQIVCGGAVAVCTLLAYGLGFTNRKAASAATGLAVRLFVCGMALHVLVMLW